MLFRSALLARRLRQGQLGDQVALGQDEHGIVVCSIDAGQYSEACPSEQWGYLKKGVVVKFPSYGLIHYEEPEPGLRLLARRTRHQSVFG